MVEYRGYGLSQGSPSEDGLYSDALAALEYLHSRDDINTDEIVVFGRSLGNIKNFHLKTCSRYVEPVRIIHSTSFKFLKIFSYSVTSNLLKYANCWGRELIRVRRIEVEHF